MTSPYAVPLAVLDAVHVSVPEQVQEQSEAEQPVTAAGWGGLLPGTGEGGGGAGGGACDGGGCH